MIPYVDATECDGLRRFATTFRRSLYSSLEYSFSESSDTVGTMIAVEPTALPTVSQFSARWPFAFDWMTAIERVCRCVQPTALLYRIDWRSDLPIGFTLYLNFPDPPTDAAFARIIEHVRPYQWDGPSPADAAHALRLPGPHGMGIRSVASGEHRLSIYFRPKEGAGVLNASTMSELAAAAGLESVTSLMLQDVLNFGRPSEVSVIGLDGSPPNGLKFDLLEVPLRTATQLLAKHGVSENTWSRVLMVCTVLRAARLTYLGLKYCASGFAGWRAYLSTAPRRLTRAAAPSWNVATELVEQAARAPHY